MSYGKALTKALWHAFGQKTNWNSRGIRGNYGRVFAVFIKFFVELV